MLCGQMSSGRPGLPPTCWEKLWVMHYYSKWMLVFFIGMISHNYSITNNWKQLKPLIPGVYHIIYSWHSSSSKWVFWLKLSLFVCSHKGHKGDGKLYFTYYWFRDFLYWLFSFSTFYLLLNKILSIIIVYYQIKDIIIIKVFVFKRLSNIKYSGSQTFW